MYIRLLYRYRYYVLVSAVLIIPILVYFGIQGFSIFEKNEGYIPKGAESHIIMDKLISTIGDPSYEWGGIIVLIEGNNGLTASDAHFKIQYNLVKQKLHDYPLWGIVGFYDHPEQIRLVSDDRQKALILAKLTTNDIDYSSLSKQLSSVTDLKVTIGGFHISTEDFRRNFDHDLIVPESIAVPLLFILLILSLGGLGSGLVPWAICIWTVFATLSILVAINMSYPIDFTSAHVVAMFGLGLAIDYTLIVVSRFREERLKHPDLHVSKIARRTFETACRTVTFSAMTVVMSLSGGMLFHELFIYSMCMSVMFAALVAAFGVSTFLLALLCILDKFVLNYSTEWFSEWISTNCWKYCSKCFPYIETSTSSSLDTYHSPSKIPEDEASDELAHAGFWYNLGLLVVTRPIAIVTSVSVLLLVLTIIGAAKIQYGLTDTAELPVGSRSRNMHETLHKSFSKFGKASLYIYFETAPGAVLSTEFLSSLHTFQNVLKSQNDVVHIQSILSPGNYSYSYSEYLQILTSGATASINKPISLATNLKNFTVSLVDPLGLLDVTASHTYMEVALSSSVYSTATQDMITLIQLQLPQYFINSSGGSVLVSHGVTGQAVFFRDLYADLAKNIPGCLSIACLTVFFVIAVMTSSILLPINAILMSVLSLGATLGIMVLIFQLGWLSPLLGFTPIGYMNGSYIIFIFAVSFGLSVDYELFLLSHVLERRNRIGTGNDTKSAVIYALQKTGSLITSAAIMLSIATLSFVASPVYCMKFIGLGIAVAVLIDATVVRMLLVPASVIVFGNWNWYCPPPLRVLVDFLGLQEAPDTLYLQYDDEKTSESGDQIVTERDPLLVHQMRF